MAIEFSFGLETIGICLYREFDLRLRRQNSLFLTFDKGNWFAFSFRKLVSDFHFRFLRQTAKF